jgi:hypothetical protein
MASEINFDFNSVSSFNFHMPSLLNFISQLKEGEYTLKVEKKRKRRSLNANAYLWEMCNQLAIELTKDGQVYTKEDIYRNAIKCCGIYKDFAGLSVKDADTLRHAWEMLGTGWLTEQVDYMPDGENVIVRCYYGSSQYNTKQMSRIIDHIVQDCKSVGIDVMTEQERSLLLQEWENEQKK